MLVLLAIVFVGMARMILGVVYGDARGRRAPRCAETLPLVGGPAGPRRRSS